MEVLFSWFPGPIQGQVHSPYPAVVALTEIRRVMSDSDYELIQAIGRKEGKAFQSFVERYRKTVFNFIFRLLGDRFAAEDLVQEVFLRIYRSAGGFEPRAKVSTWVFRIAYNLSLNELKRRSRFVCMDQIEEVAGIPAPDVLREDELAKNVRAMIRQLPEKQRAALLLRVNEDLSYAEIGSVLSVSVASVESLIFRARDRLRKLLKESEE
jgi:RNA polymerase sigma-70 factor (ECF subfamily)